MSNDSLLKKTTIYIFVVLCAYAGACSAGEVTLGRLAAEISRIKYQTNNEYLVETTVENKLMETVTLKSYEVSFFAQSEVLGRWIELGHHAASGLMRIAGLAMSGEGKWKTREIIAIPLTLPHLYRNHDGDINVMFRYKLKFTRTASPREHEDEGESAYWVTPKTNRWVFREGM